MMLLRVMVRVPLLLVGSLIMAVLTSPQLALIFVVLIPVVLVALIWIINKTFPMFGEVQRRLDSAQHGDAGEPGRRAGGQSLRPRRPRDAALPRRQRPPDGSEHHRRAHWAP